MTVALGVTDYDYGMKNSVLVRQIDEANARGDNAHGLVVDIAMDVGLVVYDNASIFWDDLTSGDPDRQGDALQGASDALIKLAAQRKLTGRPSKLHSTKQPKRPLVKWKQSQPTRLR